MVAKKVAFWLVLLSPVWSRGFNCFNISFFSVLLSVMTDSCPDGLRLENLHLLSKLSRLQLPHDPGQLAAVVGALCAGHVGVRRGGGRGLGRGGGGGGRPGGGGGGACRATCAWPAPTAASRWRRRPDTTGPASPSRDCRRPLLRWRYAGDLFTPHLNVCLNISSSLESQLSALTRRLKTSLLQ